MTAPGGRSVKSGAQLTGELRDTADHRASIDPETLVPVEGSDEPIIADPPAPPCWAASGATF